MALIKSCKGVSPVIPKSCWLADNATVIGDVKLGENCSIWFSTVVRGDVNSIEIGNQVNIQDGVVIHCTFEKTKTIIGNNVSVGHNAIIHGCIIHDDVLVGMGAIVMDNAEVHSNVIIAAGSVVTQNTILEPNAIYAGIPAKKIKSLNTKNENIQLTAENYLKYAEWFKNEL